MVLKTKRLRDYTLRELIFAVTNFCRTNFCKGTLSGLNFAWINFRDFRDFRVFWPFSQNFVHTKFLKLQFLPKPPGKWKNLGEKQADSRNKVHAKFLGIGMKYRENRNKFHNLVDFQFNSLNISFRVKRVSK